MPATPSASASVPSSMRDQLPGVWDLSHWEYRNDATGHVSLPWDGHAKGRFIFDAHGRVSVQMMRTDRPGDRPSTGPSWASALTPEEMSAILDGYLGYWGTYEIDEAARLLTIHVEGCLRPGWLGVDQFRNYELSPEGALTLIYEVPGGVHRLTWQRQ
jgi:hypothetical protein